MFYVHVYHGLKLSVGQRLYDRLSVQPSFIASCIPLCRTYQNRFRFLADRHKTDGEIDVFLELISPILLTVKDYQIYSMNLSKVPSKSRNLKNQPS